MTAFDFIDRLLVLIVQLQLRSTLCVCVFVCVERKVSIELMENPARVSTLCAIFHIERFNAVSSAADAALQFLLLLSIKTNDSTRERVIDRSIDECSFM